MPKNFLLLITVLCFLFSSSGIAGNQLYKCAKNGSFQYQQTPCASEVETDVTTTSQKKSPAQSSAKGAASSPQSGRASSSVDTWEKPHINSAKPTTFRCDGRTRCTQMKSCEEAKFFLSNCPGVKMDGDHDGIPCEDDPCDHSGRQR